MGEDLEADYVIVGAGSAGCVLANRLSADPANKVILLEAGGPDRHPLIRLPFAFLKLQSIGSLGWNYMSEPEPGLDGRRLALPRGKVLGGTSSINGMVYSRGHPADYDEWEALGAKGWSWRDVLPYFKHSERSWRGPGKWHGGTGPLPVTPVDVEGRLHEKVMATARAKGFEVSDDQHGDRIGEGFAPPEVTVENGRRASSATQYLRPVLGRSNLQVLTGVTALRIVVEDGAARGVEIERSGSRGIARARREVILSAGAYNSPKLLLLSGIGPAEELRDLSIEVIADLPGVGNNLQEHPLTGVAAELKEPIGFDSNLRADRLGWNLLRYAAGKSPKATQLPVTAFAFMRTQEGLDRADIKANIYPTRLDARVWFPLLRKPAGHAITVFSVLLRPFSRGSMKLRSPDPHEAPAIRIAMYEDERDLATMRRSVRQVRDFLSGDPLAASLGREIMPGEQVATDDAIDAYNKQFSVLAHHASGTCAMGQGRDAVLDPQLRVRGVDRLRVVDASVMPRVIGGNTHAPVVMIAERAADLILGKPTLPPEG